MLAVVVGMASSYAFATPPAMTTVVLGTGSGWTTNAQMAKFGFLTLNRPKSKPVRPRKRPRHNPFPGFDFHKPISAAAVFRGSVF